MICSEISKVILFNASEILFCTQLDDFLYCDIKK